MQTSKGGEKTQLFISKHTMNSYKLCFRFPQNEVFYMNDLHSAFAADALASTHPLNPPEADIQSPTDINDLFDDITYSKVGDGD